MKMDEMQTIDEIIESLEFDYDDIEPNLTIEESIEPNLTIEEDSENYLTIDEVIESLFVSGIEDSYYP